MYGESRFKEANKYTVEHSFMWIMIFKAKELENSTSGINCFS
jgi:hypothetical protein